MKAFKPIVLALIGLIVLSVTLGLLLESLEIVISYSATFYLLLCLATAGHFIEENWAKAWDVPDVLFEGGKKPAFLDMDRSFFILFSHSLVITSFLFYFPIADGASWAMLYGLGLAAFFGIPNGIVHFVIYAKKKVNTGCISGFFQLVFGLLVWISAFIPV